MDVEDYYRKYGPMVLRRCRKLLGNEQMAQEALQETFLRLLDRPLLEHCTASYFYTVATNLCLNTINSKEYRRGLAPNGECADLIAALDLEARSVSRNLLSRFFCKVDSLTQQIAIYHFIDEMTLEETANLLGQSVPQVRRKLHKLSKISNAWREG